MGETAITWFEDAPYEFLSNFHPATVRLDGVEHPTVEHAYQAAKTLDLLEREHVRSAPTPAVAKERGRQVTVRSDWDDVKVAVMRDLLVQKFSDPVLRERLAATAPRELIEGNTWGDRFWGVYEGQGENWLGRLLMEIRDAGEPTAHPWRRRGSWTMLGLGALMLLAAGCGSGGEKKASSAAEEVKLVYLGPVTGEFANVGVAGRDAVQLAVDEANARGDLPVRLALEVFDTQLDPAQAQLLATKAVTDRGIIGSVGPLSSGESKAVAPTFDEGGLSFVTVASNPDLARHGWKSFHRLMANDEIQGNEVARYLDKALKARTVSVVHDNTEYGKALALVAEKALKERGVATQVAVIDPKALDYSAAVNIVKARQPAAIFYGGYYPEAGRLVKQLRDGGVTAPFVAGDASKDPGIGQGAGKAAEGVLATCACTDPQHQSDPASQAFVKAYQDRFGRPPQLYSAEFYDGTQLLIDAIRRGARTRDAVLANLNSTTLQGVTKKFSFQPDGEVGVGEVYVYEFSEGAFVPLGTTAALAP